MKQAEEATRVADEAPAPPSWPRVWEVGIAWLN